VIFAHGSGKGKGSMSLGMHQSAVPDPRIPHVVAQDSQNMSKIIKHFESLKIHRFRFPWI